MKKFTVKRALVLFSIGFVLFFLFRLGYGYTVKPEEQENIGLQDQSLAREIQSKNNYASMKMAPAPSPTMAAPDQKYEKICSSDATTESFQNDEKKIYDAIASSNAVIQFEQRMGLEPNRMLKLSIGVPQNNFDQMVSSIQKIGKITGLRIDKVDKTNDYNQLQASLASLTKTRDALIALKSQSGKIDEYINLEYKIMELEESIQNLGVSLGEFDTTNEFCTVKFVLTEKLSSIKTISLYHRIKVALEWTIKYYTMSLLAAALFIVSLWCLTKIIDFARGFRNT